MGEIINGWERVGWLRVDVSQGFEIPWGYGLSYQRWDCGKSVCYPLPINWLVWIVREMWLRIKSVPQGIEHKSYITGLHVGYKDGFDFGYKHGVWAEKHRPKGVVYKNSGNNVWLKSDE